MIDWTSFGLGVGVGVGIILGILGVVAFLAREEIRNALYGKPGDD